CAGAAWWGWASCPAAPRVMICLPGDRDGAWCRRWACSADSPSPCAGASRSASTPRRSHRSVWPRWPWKGRQRRAARPASTGSLPVASDGGCDDAMGRRFFVKVRPRPAVHGIGHEERNVNQPQAQAWLEGDVLARCRRGEELAWRKLYAAHFDFVYRSAWRLGADAEEVEDICQEVFVVAFRKLSSLVDGRFTTWLYRVVANLVAYRHRQRRFREMLRSLWGHQASA